MPTAINLHSETLPRVDGKKHGEMEEIKLRRGVDTPLIFVSDRKDKRVLSGGRRILPHPSGYDRP